jgi:hypothetical protein
MLKLKVRNYQEFINESYDTDLSQVFHRFYMLVRKPFPTTSSNVLGKMIGDVRNTLFDQVSVNEANYSILPIQPGVPILNFTEDNDIVQRMIDEKLLDRNTLYNDPAISSLVSDKVVFHKTFKNCDFVPKTVFSMEDAMEMEFPVIAKPAQGKSAEGIKKLDSPNELSSSSEKFDVFSEMIDIAKEFRCFCFKDTIMEINERIKIEGSEDFLKNSETTTDFYYKKVDPETYEYKQRINEILSECRKLVKLDFFSIDFAETPDGQLFVIEMNSRTGMGADKMVELYTLIHKDFYKRSPNKFSVEKMEKIVQDWKSAYDEEKGSDINECTTVAGKLSGTTFLFKNRDRSYTPDTKVIREKVNGTEIVYYTDQTGWIEGMNEHGVGFVFSQLTGKDWEGYSASYHVSDEPKDDSKFEKFAKGIKNVLTAKNANDAISKLRSSKKSGSFLIGDSTSIYEVEVFEGKHKQRKLSFSEKPYYAKTNHGVLITHAGHQPSGYGIKRASSEIRMHQAIEQLQGIQDITQIPERMKFQAFDPDSPLNVFRTDPEEYTISQCMMDLTNLTFYFFHDTTTADSFKLEDKIKDGKIKIDARKI